MNKVLVQQTSNRPHLSNSGHVIVKHKIRLARKSILSSTHNQALFQIWKPIRHTAAVKWANYRRALVKPLSAHNHISLTESYTTFFLINEVPYRLKRSSSCVPCAFHSRSNVNVCLAANDPYTFILDNSGFLSSLFGSFSSSLFGYIKLWRYRGQIDHWNLMSSQPGWSLHEGKAAEG